MLKLIKLMKLIKKTHSSSFPAYTIYNIIIETKQYWSAAYLRNKTTKCNICWQDFIMKITSHNDAGQRHC